MYILKNREVVPCDDVIEWGEFMQKPERIIKQENIGDIKVSTVFLGIDHDFFRNGPPLVFETMMFGGPFSHECLRSRHILHAKTDHEVIVNLARFIYHTRGLSWRRVKPVFAKMAHLSGFDVFSFKRQRDCRQYYAKTLKKRRA